MKAETLKIEYSEPRVRVRDITRRNGVVAQTQTGSEQMDVDRINGYGESDGE